MLGYDHKYVGSKKGHRNYGNDDFLNIQKDIDVTLNIHAYLSVRICVCSPLESISGP